MLPEELTKLGLFEIIILTLFGTYIFMTLILFIIAAYIWTGKHWLARIESIFLRGIEKLDKYYYWILDKVFGRHE